MVSELSKVHLEDVVDMMVAECDCVIPALVLLVAEVGLSCYLLGLGSPLSKVEAGSQQQEDADSGMGVERSVVAVPGKNPFGLRIAAVDNSPAAS